MRTHNPLVMAAIVFAASSTCVQGQQPGPDAGSFRFDPVTDRSLGLWDGGTPVLVYNHGPIASPGAPASRGRACYFHPVYGLDGEVITDDFPRDHTYHRGMYVAWPHIKLGDKEYELWTARGDLKQVFQKFLSQRVTSRGAELGIENAWMIGEQPQVREEMWIKVHPIAGDTRSIDVRLSWTPLTQSLTLSGAEGKSYGGFNFRFGPRTKTTITVPVGTTLPEGVTADSGRVSGDLLVTKLPWADFTGDFQGAKDVSGAAIFVHPQHPDFPPTWMTRHYGLVSIGWPGVEPQTFPAGHTITCQYRVWIHRGSKTAAEIQAAYGHAWPMPN